jgi:hypothetical protein
MDSPARSRPTPPGTWEERDNDGDGTADDILYTFPAEELTDELTLERWLLVQLEAGLADAMPMLRFGNNGTEAIDYS